MAIQGHTLGDTHMYTGGHVTHQALLTAAPSEVGVWDGPGASSWGSSSQGCGWTTRAHPTSCLAGAGLLIAAASFAPSLQVFVVEYLGRRALLLLGFSVCFIACCVLTVALALQVRKLGPTWRRPEARAVSLSPSALTYVIGKKTKMTLL